VIIDDTQYKINETVTYPSFWGVLSMNRPFIVNYDPQDKDKINHTNIEWYDKENAEYPFALSLEKNN
jgi:hypothetical protein